MSTYLEFDYIKKNTFSSRSCANDNHSSRGDAKYKFRSRSGANDNQSSRGKAKYKFRSRNNDKYRFTATANYKNLKG